MHWRDNRIVNYFIELKLKNNDIVSAIVTVVVFMQVDQLKTLTEFLKFTETQ